MKIALEQVRGSESLAPLSSPYFSGAPKAPTPSQAETETSRLATVGFVRTAIAAGGGGGGGGGGAAYLYVTDDNNGNIELTAMNTSSSLSVDDDNSGNIEITLI